MKQFHVDARMQFTDPRLNDPLLSNRYAYSCKLKLTLTYCIRNQCRTAETAASLAHEANTPTDIPVKAISPLIP